MAELLDKSPRLKHLKNTTTILNGLKKRRERNVTRETNANDLQNAPDYQFASANDNLNPAPVENGATAINPIPPDNTIKSYNVVPKVAKQGITDNTMPIEQEPISSMQMNETPNNEVIEKVGKEADTILKDYAFKNNPQAYEDLKETFTHIGENWKSVQDDFNNGNVGTGTLKLLNTAFETVSAPFPIADAILKQNEGTKLIADGVNYLFENADNLMNIYQEIEKGASKEVLKTLGINSDFLDSEGMEQFNLLRKNIAYVIGGEVGIKGFKKAIKPVADKLGIDTSPAPIKQAKTEIDKLKTALEEGKIEDRPLTLDETGELLSEVKKREKIVKEYDETFNPKPDETKTSTSTVENKPIEIKEPLIEKPGELLPIDKTELSKQVESVNPEIAELIKNSELSPDELKVIQEVLPKQEKLIEIQKGSADTSANIETALQKTEPSLENPITEQTKGFDRLLKDEFVSEKDIYLKDKYGLEKLSLMPRGDAVKLDLVKVSKMGEGNGTQFMKDLIEWADKNGKRLDLTPSTDFGATSIDRLKSFYKKFDFVENKGKFKDYEISESMYREPKKVKLIKPESYQQAVKNVKSRGSQINSNPFDPTVFKDIYTIGKFHLEQGLKNFAEWSKKIISDVGDWIKPHVQKIWTEINKDRTGLKDVVTQGADFDKILDMMKSKNMIDESKYLALKEKHKTATEDIKVGEKKGSKEMNEKTLNAELQEVGKRFAEDNPELIAEAKRQRITSKQMIENAKSKAEYLTDNDIKNLKPGDIKNTEEAMSLAMYQQAKILKALKDTSISELERADLVSNAFKDYVKVNAIYSEGARLTGSKRFLPDLPIEDLKSYADLLKDVDSDLYNSIIGEVNKLKTEQNPTARDKITSVLYELMLSRPTTHIRNIVGNSAHLGYELGTMALSNPLDIPRIVKGLKDGAKQIPSEIRKTIKGEDGSQVKFVDFKMTAPKNNVVRGMLPTTWLKIEDNFFKSLAKGVETEMQKKVLSKSTKESLNVVSDNIKKVLDGKLLETPEKTAQYLQSIEEINKFADYVTFQTELGKFGKGLVDLQNSSKLGIALKVLVPFVKTPANILKAGFAPLKVLKFASKEFRQKYSEMSAREKSHVNRRIIAGTVFYSTIASLVASDVIQVTGNGAIDKSKRDYLEKLGYKPNHVYINGVGFSYQNLPPFSQLFALLGNYSDGLKYNVKPKDDELNFIQKVTKSLAGFISTTTDQSFLSGISEFFKFIETGNENYWERFVTMPMPAILSSYKDYQTYFKGDNTDYETNSFGDRLGKRTGFYGDLKAKLNVFGEDKKTIYETLPVPSKLNTKDDNTRLERFLLTNNINIGYPSENIIKANGETLTKEEYREYLKKTGQELKKAIMNGTVNGKNSFDYLNSIPIDEADKEIKHLRNEIRDEIKEDMFGKKENKGKKYNYKLKPIK